MGTRLHSPATGSVWSKAEWLAGWAARLCVLPLGAALLVYPSLERTASVVDGPDTTCHGAPFIWNCDGLAASLSHDFYVVPLLIDLVIVLAISAGLVWLIRLLLRRWPLLRALAVVSIWLWGGLCALALSFFFTHDGWFSPWIPEEYSLHNEFRVGDGL